MCRLILLPTLLFAAAVALGGCQAAGQRTTLDPFNNGNEKVALNADDVVLAMRRAGFGDEQILEHGPGVRNALATQGGVRVRTGRFTEAIFVADGGELYGVSLANGAFRYVPASALVRREDEEGGEAPSAPPASDGS